MPRRHYRRGGGGNLFGAALFVPPIPVPFYSNNTLSFFGPWPLFMAQWNNLSPQDRANVKIINVQIHGEVVQQPKVCCFICTAVAGGFFIFPLCLLCCDCYKKFISQLRKLPVEVYQLLNDVIGQCPLVQNITIGVADNWLNAEKCAALERNATTRCNKLFVFNFSNLCQSFDMDGREYSDFKKYFQAIQQSQRFMYSLRWMLKAVVNQNPGSNITGGISPNMNLTNMNMNMGYDMMPMIGNPINAPLTSYPL